MELPLWLLDGGVFILNKDIRFPGHDLYKKTYNVLLNISQIHSQTLCYPNLLRDFFIDVFGRSGDFRGNI